MKLLIVLTVISWASAKSVENNIRLDEYAPDTRHILLTQSNNGKIKVMNLKDTRLQRAARLTDLTYYLFTRNNRESPLIIKNNNVTSLKESRVFVPRKQNVFIIHGWDNDYSSPVNTLITKALLDSYDVNVFAVDWGVLATKNYFTARYAVPKIGKFVGEFLNGIVSEFRVSHKDIILIGHSLGAHVAGAAGAIAKEKIDHIVGLDPAQPLFTLVDISGRLDPTDADFVHIIHTNGGRLGFLSPLGHADYYPNGGSSQPGCWFDLVGSCSHSRSYLYYADSIIEKERQFLAYKCDSYKDFKKGKCNSSENVSVMGRLEADKKANGSYYLQTKSKEPYAEAVVE